MKMILAILFLLQAAPGVAQILNLHTGEVAGMDELAAAGDVFVLGERHYEPKIQKAQAGIMTGIMAEMGGGAFDLGWEFLNTDQGEEIRQGWEEFLAGSLTGEAFLNRFTGTYEGNTSYLALLDVARAHGSGIIPLNLSRSIKSQVSRGGIEALDPQYLPVDYQPGSQAYYERFMVAMGGHGDAAMANYFAAQSLVDNVMAASLLEHRQQDTSFLICGSFHSDYGHGVVEELNRRGNAAVVSVRFVVTTGLADSQVREMLYSEAYGPVADFAILLP